jgi:hypothetical protein
MDSLAFLFEFPTNIFFYPLIFIIFYWVVVSIGLLDMEMLDFDTEIEGDGEGFFENWLSKLGLDGVPLIIAITLLDVYGFSFAYLGRKYLMPLLDGVITATAAGTVVAIGALLLAIPLSAVCIKPLRKVFVTHEAISKQDLVGSICVVTTSKVNQTFGQAETLDGMRLNVRAPTPNSITRGSNVALIEFNEQTDCYSVVTEAELMAMASS